MIAKEPNSPRNLLFIHNFSPRQVFQADAFGALLTTTILGLVLPAFQPYLGMPKSHLYGLAALALVFFLYSLSIYWIRPKSWVPYLQGIALANASYCLLTLSLLYLLRTEITRLGYIYFIGEALLIFAIAWMEWSYAQRYKARKFG